MTAHILKTPEDHKAALAELDRLMDLDLADGTPESDRFDLLATLIDDYERRRWPSEETTPVEIIRFMMEENGLKQKDLVPYIGSPSRVSEVLSGKRSLTLPMIERLHYGLGIPASLLIQPPEKGPASTRSRRAQVRRIPSS